MRALTTFIVFWALWAMSGRPACGAQSGSPDKKQAAGAAFVGSSAPPVTLGAHFNHFTTALFSPGTLFFPAATSSASQALTSHPGYPSNITGYGWHYRDSLIGNVSGKFVGNLMLPSLFHQDESYDALGLGNSFHLRTSHVMDHLIWTRSDDHSRKVFAVSAIPAAVIMAAASNAYLPRAQRTLAATSVCFLENLGAYLFYDAFSEFRKVGFE